MRCSAGAGGAVVSCGAGAGWGQCTRPSVHMPQLQQSRQTLQHRHCSNTTPLHCRSDTAAAAAAAKLDRKKCAKSSRFCNLIGVRQMFVFPSAVKYWLLLRALGPTFYRGQLFMILTVTFVHP